MTAAVRGLTALCCLLIPAVAVAQQTGALSGRVVDSADLPLPGVTVEARSIVLPAPRVTVTEANGEYRLPALPPGDYTITFALSGMQSVERPAIVQLAQTTVVDAVLGVAGVAETVTVTASASLIDRTSAELTSAVSSEQIQSLPIGQQYRDLVKLIPGVQVSNDTIRGPSAGGSGQDNVYQFDGVNVTLPLFGTLSAEPSSHDIAQVTTVKGGARAVDFERSGGFTIDSVSKSGTSRLSGMLSFQLQNAAMVAEQASGVNSRYESDRTWTTLNIGGPLLRDRLYFYGSYYRPENRRNNPSNLYGELPEYKSTRNEGFGKVTYTPRAALLVNLSYRGSDRTDTGDTFAQNASATSGSGSEAQQHIAIAEGSWVINNRSHATFKYTSYRLDTQGRPDSISSVSASQVIGTPIDLTRLDQIGRFTVPLPIAGQTAFNDYIQPLIDRYGYVQNGARVGGGIVGYGLQFDDIDFFRDSVEAGYNITLGTNVQHDLHVGYQTYRDGEDLLRSSNGWGLITVPGGRISFQGTPIYYTAAFQQQGVGAVPTIHSEYHSHSFEFNDTIRWGSVTVNAGVLASNDSLFGQGLREDGSATLTGFRSAPGTKYEMLDIPFTRMIQPRLSTTWAYNGQDTIFASYARYNPAASSLPRAASWDRNLATTINAHFDANGVMFATTPVTSSAGKLFVDDITPRSVDEIMVGTSRQFSPSWTGRLYGRYRAGRHFWEDTNNNARVVYDPPAGVPRELYIPDIVERLQEIGTGGSVASFIIAELEDAYTDYYDVSLESEWRGSNSFIRGSYTWSRYEGNFDQDNSTLANDDNVFIGSSFIADDAGRQLWNFRDGRMRGDRPHMLKLYGYRSLPWNANIGAFAFAQSGHPWEVWSYEPYIALTTNTSDTSRFAEPAGSRRTDPHYQLDLNYTQNIELGGRLTLQLSADLFNVFNKQTGYSPQPGFHNSAFGQPRVFWDPRRLQAAARLLF
jgi:hypothetical protein